MMTFARWHCEDRQFQSLFAGIVDNQYEPSDSRGFRLRTQWCRLRLEGEVLGGVLE